MSSPEPSRLGSSRAPAWDRSGSSTGEESLPVTEVSWSRAAEADEGQGAANSGQPRLRPWIIDVLEQPGFEPYASEDYPVPAAADADAFVEDLVNLLLARATHNSTDARSKGEEVEEAARFGFEAAAAVKESLAPALHTPPFFIHSPHTGHMSSPPSAATPNVLRNELWSRCV